MRKNLKNDRVKQFRVANSGFRVPGTNMETTILNAKIGQRSTFAVVLLSSLFMLSHVQAQNSGAKSSNSRAASLDLNAPWPEAEKRGLRWKKAEGRGAEKPAATTQTLQTDDFRQIQMINGIVIVTALKEFNPDGVPLKQGLTVKNNPLLESSQFIGLANRFLGQPMNESRMRDLQREIILYYREHDRPLIDVLYPEQDVSNGMLQVIVIEGRLKEVKVQDTKGKPYKNGWSGLNFLHDSIRLRTNDVIAESKLVKDLDWLNRNPLRRVEAVYEPDPGEYGMSSVLLRVDEQRQWSADIGYDDTGSEITSEDRITAGATWGKAFGQTDHVFRYAFTGNPSLDLLRVHSANYFAPLPWRHGIRLSGYYLDVKADPGTGITLKGTAYQTSMRYEVPLPAFRKFQHEASIGADFKSSENNLFFGSSSPVNTPTEIFQIAAGYSAVLPDPWGRTSFGVQGYYSPGDVSGRNTDTDFNFARDLATANYAYARFNLERATRLPGGFTWIIRGIAQVADGNLLASEQLGMGGYATARGYDERESSGDQGYFISNELRTPPFSLLRIFGKSASLNDKLQFLGFWDYGLVANVDLTTNEDPDTRFSSVGAGLRYNISRNFALRFDYGWQLIDTGLTSNDSRGHLGVVVTY